MATAFVVCAADEWVLRKIGISFGAACVMDS